MIITFNMNKIWTNWWELRYIQPLEDRKVKNFKDCIIVNYVFHVPLICKEFYLPTIIFTFHKIKFFYVNKIQFVPEHIITLDKVLEISICNKKPSMYKIIHFSSEDVFGNSNLSRFRFFKVNCITIIKNGLKQTQILKLACDCIG